jgi:hypothetical protein
MTKLELTEDYFSTFGEMIVIEKTSFTLPSNITFLY